MRTACASVRALKGRVNGDGDPHIDDNFCLRVERIVFLGHAEGHVDGLILIVLAALDLNYPRRSEQHTGGMFVLERPGIEFLDVNR